MNRGRIIAAACGAVIALASVVLAALVTDVEAGTLSTDHLVSTEFDTGGHDGPVGEVLDVAELDLTLFDGWACDVRAYLDNDSIWQGTDLLVGPLVARDVERERGVDLLVQLGRVTGGQVLPVQVRLGPGLDGRGLPASPGPSATSIAGVVDAACVPLDGPPTTTTVPPGRDVPPPPPASPVLGTPQLTG